MIAGVRSVPWFLAKIGFRCQVSGVRKIQRAACDEPIGRESFDPELTTEGLSRVEDIYQTVLCHLTSVICLLTPDTRNLTPKFSKLLAGHNTRGFDTNILPRGE